MRLTPVYIQGGERHGSSPRGAPRALLAPRPGLASSTQPRPRRRATRPRSLLKSPPGRLLYLGGILHDLALPLLCFKLSCAAVCQWLILARASSCALSFAACLSRSCRPCPPRAPHCTRARPAQRLARGAASRAAVGRCALGRRAPRRLTARARTATLR